MNSELLVSLKNLADGFCERRSLNSLRHYLPAYCALNGMTDGWQELVIALKDVLVFAKSEISPQEKDEIKRIIRFLEDMLGNR
jgi:hypothetical protein